MYAAFPRSEYLWASPPSTVASASLRMVLSVGLLGRHANQDGGGSPRFLTLPFPDVPCSKTPPQSPAIIANSDRLLLPSRYSTLSACGCRLTRLNRFTCVTACPSLCLRLAHVVTSISPRLDFRWGGLTPCRCGNLTRWKRQAWPGARWVGTSLEAVARCGASLLSDTFVPVPSPSEPGFLYPSPRSEPIVRISRNGLPRVRSPS